MSLSRILSEVFAESLFPFACFLLTASIFNFKLEHLLPIGPYPGLVHPTSGHRIRKMDLQLNADS